MQIKFIIKFCFQIYLQRESQTPLLNRPHYRGKHDLDSPVIIASWNEVKTGIVLSEKEICIMLNFVKKFIFGNKTGKVISDYS